MFCLRRSDSFTAVTFDIRGARKSTGRATLTGFAEVKDVIAVYRWLSQNLGAHRILLIGSSVVGAESEDAQIKLLLKEVKGKDVAELIAAGREKLASVPSGGAAPAAEAQKEEKKEEKEESDDVSSTLLFSKSLGSFNIV